MTFQRFIKAIHEMTLADNKTIAFKISARKRLAAARTINVGLNKVARFRSPRHAYLFRSRTPNPLKGFFDFDILDFNIRQTLFKFHHSLLGYLLIVSQPYLWKCRKLGPIFK